VAIEHRKTAVEELRKQGRRTSEIAEQLKMPLSTVEKMQKSAWEMPTTD
jgi:hypothetical protein